MRSESVISAVLLLLGTLLAGCSAGGGASTGGTSASAGATGGFTAGISSGTHSGSQGSTVGRRAILKLSGTPGVAFSGRCTVGSRTETLAGRTPASYTFEPGGRQLECRIQKQSTGGTLEVNFDAPGSHATQRMASPNGTLEITYRDGSLSISQSST